MTGSGEELELLRRIDTKLGVLIALVLDDYVRTHGIAGARERSIEKILVDGGLSTADTAVLLGKTQRAVQKQVGGKVAGAKKGAATKRAGKTM